MDRDVTTLPLWRCIPVWLVVIPFCVIEALVLLPFDDGRRMMRPIA